MRRAALTLAAALLAPAALAGEPGSTPEPASTPRAGDGGSSEQMKGYGYGTPSGLEAHGSAGQAVQKKLEKGTTPQEEQRSPRKKGKKRKKGRGAAQAPSPDVPGAAAPSPGQPPAARQRPGEPER